MELLHFFDQTHVICKQTIREFSRIFPAVFLSFRKLFATFGARNGPKTIRNGPKQRKTARKLCEKVRKRCKTMRKRSWDDLREHPESLVGGGAICRLFPTNIKW